MGQDSSRHKRRHTVTVNPTTPYIKTQAHQVHGINGRFNNGNHHNQPFKPSTIAIPSHHPNGLQAYSADFASPNKLTRSASTPTLSDHDKITKPTIDLNATTPNQHLITTIPPKTQFQSNSGNVHSSQTSTSPKLTKKKSRTKSKNNLFPFKQKKSHHQQFNSAIPYVHFNEDSQSQQQIVGRGASKSFLGSYHGRNNRKKKSKLKRSQSKRDSHHTNGKKKKSLFMRNAFSSNDEMESSLEDIDDNSYHSDPQSNNTPTHRMSAGGIGVSNNKFYRKKLKQRRSYNSHFHQSNQNGLSSNHVAKYNPHSRNGRKKHELYARNHLRRELENDADDSDDKNKRKILLLGNGSCGKSTIFKQLKLILGQTSTFDENELSEATHAIRQNCVSVLLIILHKCTVLYERNNRIFVDCRIDENNEAIRDAINYVMKYRSESFEKVEEDLSELANNISYLWNLKCVQQTIKYRHKRFTIPDNIHYFYEQLDTIFSDHYIPTTDDIIRLRIRTTGMIENKFTMLSDNNCDEYQISLFDTGGERNERKKWIHTFENVDIVIFVAALSHFCCVLWEDEKTISMHDAVELFQEICNGKWFKRSEMILFLNKNDIFRQMLYDEISLKCGFTDIKKDDYCIKVDHPEITPPPSPNGTTLEFPDFVEKKDNDDQDGTQTQKKKNSDDIIDKTDVDDKNVTTNNNQIDEDQKQDISIDIDDGYIPYENLNEWTGKQWTGPNFKYDPNKTVEENNIYFEKCYDKAIEYIVSLFLKQNKDPNKTVYVHITNAIDEKNISDTFDEIRPLIMKTNYAGHCKQFF